MIMGLIFSSNVLANTNNQLTAALEGIRHKNHIPAMAVAIISAGEVSYINGFGYVDANKTIATTSDTSFRIASISKLFTAQAIMKLVEDGKLRLSDKVSQFLPSFNGTHMTIKQLLTHSSGLNDSIKPVDIDLSRSKASYLKSVRNTAITHVTNNAFEYSDTGFNILGHIISIVANVSYEQYINENIFIKAGMKRSKYFDGANKQLSQTPPTKNGVLIEKNKQRPYDMSFNPSEGLVTNVHDLSIWLKGTLNSDNSILKKSTYQDMLTPQVKTSWGDIYMGLGWQVYKDNGVSIARHPGGIRGYKSLVITYPDTKNALIILTNSSDAPRWEISKTMLDILKNTGQW